GGWLKTKTPLLSSAVRPGIRPPAAVIASFPIGLGIFLEYALASGARSRQPQTSRGSWFLTARAFVCRRFSASTATDEWTPMTRFVSLSDLRVACLQLPAGDSAVAATVAAREATLTKPPGSLGRLEEVVAWLAHWQGRSQPRLDRVGVRVFAGNHGVVAQGVSAYPAEVTAQMVMNFDAGRAAINQLARTATANLQVTPLALDRPTTDFTMGPAMDEETFLAAVAAGYDA